MQHLNIQALLHFSSTLFILHPLFLTSFIYQWLRRIASYCSTLLHRRAGYFGCHQPRAIFLDTNLKSLLGRLQTKSYILMTRPMSKTSGRNITRTIISPVRLLFGSGKDGVVIPRVGFVSLCYDFTVGIATLLDSNAEAYLQRRAHSTLMNRRTGYKREEFERMKRHHQAFTENSWNWQAMEPEARVCLIINRYTRDLTIMYASSACEKVFHVDPDEMTGKPVLLYIRSDDMGPFVEQVNCVKESTTVSLIRFWFQPPNWQRRSHARPSSLEQQMES
ncbi:hypothetical protein B0O80DRAFT_173993 [Mortierella sp. GBAus27b]|nr:hypothetical protein B0O80DRAFT_173993 [Mortierella sp. GBAus27b]